MREATDYLLRNSRRDVWGENQASTFDAFGRRFGPAGQGVLGSKILDSVEWVQ